MAVAPKKDQTSLRLLHDLDFDAFETGLLSIARHFQLSFDNPDTQSWQRAYAISVERWGEAVGLPVAHCLLKVLQALGRCRTDGMAFQDPLCPQSRNFASDDEYWLIQLLHHMRREETSGARVAVEKLTLGRMDPDVIRTGLYFGSRFSCGAPDKQKHRMPPNLRLV